MKEYNKHDFEILINCPWCQSKKQTHWGRPVRGFNSVACDDCGLIYIKNRLNNSGLQKFYKSYLSDIHQADSDLNQKREIMYALEFNLINSYCKKGAVLDVGCSGGYFLDLFQKAGFVCFGVEYGEEAAKIASLKHAVYFGDFPSLKINKKFDLVVFRGVIEHVPYPKLYFKKAITLLKKGGFVYITSTPNSNSFCCGLFREKWNQHEPEEHLMHFNTKHFDIYFKNNNFKKLTEHFFYEETPYANIEENILSVANAIKLKKTKRAIRFNSPAFYSNMMSLIYKKQA